MSDRSASARILLLWFIAAFFIAVFIGICSAVVVGTAAALCDISPQETSLDSEEQAFLVIINQYRAQSNRPALALSPGLTRAAAWMAKDLSTHNYFDHTSSDGRSPYQRARDCGYPYGTGENIAGGFATAQQVFQAWQQSPGHNNNMLGNYAVIGIARAFGGPYGVYWVTDFGTVTDFSNPTPTPTWTPRPAFTPTPTPAPTPTTIINPIIYKRYAPQLSKE